MVQPCIHRGSIIGYQPCAGCQGRVYLAVYACDKLNKCTLSQCSTCPHQSPPDSPGKKEHSNDPTSLPSSTLQTHTEQGSSLPAVEHPAEGIQSTMEPAQAAPFNTQSPLLSKIRWAYGIQSTLERVKDLLPRTIASLRGAGFLTPRLFVDGCSHRYAMQLEEEHHLPITIRAGGELKCSGNWTLALLELFTRNPSCDRYAIFQDDMVTCQGLIQYLNRLTLQPKTYWNLMCAFENDGLLVGKEPGFYDGCPFIPQRPGMAKVTQQGGRGAVALVFSREGVVTLLSDRDFMARPMSANNAHRAVDGGIVTAMNKAGYRELVHYPSLVQHTGDRSTIGHKPHQLSKSFVGEQFDAVELLDKHPAHNSL